MKWFITGGCGFIGVNAAMRFAEDGDEVVVMDSLSRNGVHRNLGLLRDELGVECHVADVRDRDALERLLSHHRDTDTVLHLAGQVSLLASIEDPRRDFETNALGTFNLLEAVRRYVPNATVIYASTNKVYGDLAHLRIEERELRYELVDFPNGIDESMPLDFRVGYGCSKGAADQYVLDYHRSYGLRTVSFRQSSVYGGRQYATADQGWLSYFVQVGVADTPFRINGNGKQVRDALHVTDLVELYRKCVDRIDHVAGQAFNVGGGPSRSSSLLELFETLRDTHGLSLTYESGPPRPADQKVFIADIRRVCESIGWMPTVELKAGVRQLVDSVRERERR